MRPRLDRMPLLEFRKIKRGAGRFLPAHRRLQQDRSAMRTSYSKEPLRADGSKYFDSSPPKLHRSEESPGCKTLASALYLSTPQRPSERPHPV